MSDHQAQGKKSLVDRSTVEGMGNAAAGIARSTTRSGVSFGVPNVSGSRATAKKTAKMMDEQKANASTEQMAHGNTPQFYSYAYPPTAGRAGGVTPLAFMNSSSRKSQSPMVVPG